MKSFKSNFKGEKMFITRYIILIIFSFALFAKGAGSATGGAAILFDDGESDVGLNVELTRFTIINSNISIGGKIGFNRWTDKEVFNNGDTTSFNLKTAVSILEIAPLLRVNAPINTYSRLFFEPSIGYSVIISRTDINNDSDIVNNPVVGISLATGLDVKHFEIKPMYKMSLSNGYLTKWIVLSVGVFF